MSDRTREGLGGCLGSKFMESRSAGFPERGDLGRPASGVGLGEAEGEGTGEEERGGGVRDLGPTARDWAGLSDKGAGTCPGRGRAGECIGGGILSGESSNLSAEGGRMSMGGGGSVSAGGMQSL